MTKTFKRVVSVTAAAIMLASALAGCGKQTQPIDASNPSIDILCKSFNASSADSKSPVVQELQKYLASQMGVKNLTLNIKWAPSATYSEKTVTTMGSGVYPHAMLVGTRNSSVIVAARKGIFWDITSAFAPDSKYKNLKQANPLVNKNISIDGKNYGIYRARELGRAGVTIRKDWLDKLGEPIPQTMEDFDRVMRRFTEDDPDGDGQNDTYGMIISTYLQGPLENLAIWSGSPNGWGIDPESGELRPSFMFDQYVSAMDKIHEWYNKGYINQNMASLPDGQWNQDFLNGKAGIIIDVADRARRVAGNIVELDPNAVVDVFGYVKRDENTPARTLPTTGYDSFYVLPTPSLPTEENLDFMLGIMDHLNDLEATHLMNYGIEGIHYTVDENNYAEKTKDKTLLAQYNDLNQLSMGIVSYDNDFKTKYDASAKAVAEKVEATYADNKLWAVSNPAEPYVSPTQTRRGTTLDDIMTNAKTKYCVGTISLDQYKTEIQRWLDMGGRDVIKEMNNSFALDEQAQANKDQMIADAKALGSSVIIKVD
ncbi:MAG: extracellular solute-binding protein [Clostridia bacterium]|nr:extracellular solute-binding protein [Clostridia bacterium]